MNCKFKTKFQALSIILCCQVFFVLPLLAAKHRDLLKSGSISEVVIEYNRIARNTHNPSLAAEYSYVLTLMGQYDLGLSQIDKAFIMNASNADVLFFGSEILKAFGLKDAAAELTQPKPAWFNPEYPALPLVGYERDTTNLKGELSINNLLMTQKRYITAVIRFSKLVKKHPQEPLVWQGYAISLEKIGAYKTAAKTVEKYLLLETNEEDIETGRNYKTMLERQKPIKPAKSRLNLKGRYLSYFGGGINHLGIDTLYNLNFRFGKYLTNNFDASVYGGWRGGYEDSDYNGISLGLSGRLSAGLPVNNPVSFTFAWKLERFPASEDELAFLMGPGLSYFLKDSSIDLYWDFALSGVYKNSHTLSAGYTIYFGKASK
ncbi:MAG: hypothetical protein HY746_05790 [Elusimicrobia bacterium]|nr:hypothetical protein [Elusimicrobiota bacterium]